MSCHDLAMDQQAARAFADRWITLWNTGDLDGLLEHFADDVIFTSPTATRLIDGCDGVVRGKSALRAYWAHGLSLNPQLRFELVGLYVGIRTLVINFQDQSGVLVNEVLAFDGPLIVEGHATHLQRQPAVDDGMGA